MINANADLVFHFDADQRMNRAELYGQGALAGLNVTLHYAHDPNGNRVAMLDPTGPSVYHYDAGNRLTRLVTPEGREYTWSYSQTTGRLASMKRPGSNTAVLYDSLGFVTRLEHIQGTTSAGDLLSTFRYSRDTLGNRTEVFTPASAGSPTRTFSYDSLSQLTDATLNDAPTAGTQSEGYDYDPLSNRRLPDGTPTEDQVEYDTKGQRLNKDARYTYSYDENGNMVARIERCGALEPMMNCRTQLFEYSVENQLRRFRMYEPGDSVDSPRLEVIYRYDGLGRRIAKQVIDHQAPTDTQKNYERRFIPDGQDVLLEYDGSNNLLARYTHSGIAPDDTLGVQVTWAGQQAGLAKVAGTYQYLKDALGSVTDIVDSSGAYVQRYVYSAFGVLLAIRDAQAEDVTSDPLVATTYGFTGREHERESGLMYYRARYYDPSTGRFLQKDPEPGKMSVPMSVVNQYAYVGNNPLNILDPSGMDWWTDIRDGLWAFVAAAAVIFTGGAAAAIIGGGGFATVAAGIGNALAQAIISTTLAATLNLVSSIALAAGQGLATGEWGSAFWNRVGKAYKRSAYFAASILSALGIGASFGLGGGFGPIRLGFSTQTDILGRAGIQLGPVTGLFGKNVIEHELGHFFLQYAPLQFLGGLASPHGAHSGFFWGAGIYGAMGIAGWYYPGISESWLPFF